MSALARHPLAALLLCLAGLCGAPRLAFADPCGRPDLRATFPADGASNVPVNATLSAVYAETADYLDEPVELSSAGVATPVSAEFDASERRLSIASPALAPNTSYTLVWPALRGLSSAGHGLGRTITFATGAGSDVEAPEFAGIRKVSWDLEQVRDDCTDDLESRFRFDFELGGATDDGGRDSLALLLFQTRGPGTREEGPRVVAQTGLAQSERARVQLTVGEATGRVCFAAVVRDLLGRISTTGSDEHCVRTTAPPFFYGCAMRAGAPNLVGPGSLGLVFALVARRRRRWRAG
ncbi:MAG TPA: Ig-like domain-containing protein [Polyangiaceae bacterium]|jgi:hypothetical protein|nr:Ig-like domain-containing protein [Polyangiaceae bacterium]